MHSKGAERSKVVGLEGTVMPKSPTDDELRTLGSGGSWGMAIPRGNQENGRRVGCRQKTLPRGLRNFEGLNDRW